MSEEQNPYTTLSLLPDASQSQVKAAYRKLALKYHPDKQSSDQEKKRCSEIFARIGNAYEILGDPERRAHFDKYGSLDAATVDYSQASQQQQQQQQQQRGRHDPFMSNSFFGGQHPIFSRGNPGGHGSGGFMDPFDLFQQFFQEEFSHHDQFHGFGAQSQRQNGHHDEHKDRHNLHHSQEHHRNVHENMHHQFNSGMMGNFGFDGGFGAGMGMGMGMGNNMGMNMGMGMGGQDPIAQHMQAMNSMMNMQSSFSSNNNNNNIQQHGNGGAGHGTFYSSSTSSSSYSGGRNAAEGIQESVSTSTRIINGRRQTIIERVRVHPDGRIEKTTETSGDDNFPTAAALGYGSSNSGQNHGGGGNGRIQGGRGGAHRR